MGEKPEFETTDGSRPHFSGLGTALQRAHPLGAFALLEGGDAFEPALAQPPKDGPDWARKAVARWTFRPMRGTESAVSRVQADMQRQLSGNPALAQRLLNGRGIVVEILTASVPWTQAGYPASVASNTSGLFWDDPQWPEARLALRVDRLEKEPHLVFHELAHGLCYLAFTAEERALLVRKFLRTYKVEHWVDEAFALYSEREFVHDPSADDLRAPGIYGHVRRRWSNDHLLTRFVRHLYFPYKPF
jgi:hypothetical protein